MTDSDENRRHTGEALTQRRVELSPEWKNLSEFSRATGVTYKTLQRIEGGVDHRFSTGTLLELDRAYQYPAGTIRGMLDGAAPPTETPAGPLLVPRDSRPPIERASEPSLRMRNRAPLTDGEALEGWPLPKGDQWHYRFTTTDGLDLRMPVDEGTSLDDVVKRMRAMAAVARM
ncbi:helix-turn-helix domain-containing protein [Bacillus mobilis]